MRNAVSSGHKRTDPAIFFPHTSYFVIALGMPTQILFFADFPLKNQSLLHSKAGPIVHSRIHLQQRWACVTQFIFNRGGHVYHNSSSTQMGTRNTGGHM